ncbi:MULTISPECIES: CHASE2 domain-containing protein [unclassified Microcoleus]|uniref:CHASE2 domain-containing protein n=1 Tax=unclassified Microcoleus TaxID=2642155 RepID=UPI002FD27793
MDKLIVVKLDGNCEEGFRCTLTIGKNNQFPSTDFTESKRLPANPEIAAFEEEHWLEKYRAMGTNSRHHQQNLVHLIYPFLHKDTKKNTAVKSAAAKGLSFRRIKPKRINARSPVNDCKESGKKLALMLNDWLKSPEFAKVDRLIGDNLNPDEEARVVICTDDKHLHKLPWNQWDLFERFPKAEPSLSKLNYVTLENPGQPIRKSKVRILAILGNSAGIDITQDKKILENLSPNADVKFLVERKQDEINDELWEQSWDIIFFAGHGETEDDIGKIYINQTDFLTINELWSGLRKAVKNGLQLAIFNCCDGLGLARNLDDFQMIPQMILMREFVPDFVAQEFLKCFLKEFVDGKSLYAAAGEARRRLETWEKDFPCASWLPVIWQHPAAKPAVWNDFLLAPDSPAVEPDLTPLPTPPKRPPVKGFSRLKSVILASAGCTLAVMGTRFLGVMEPLELSMLDRLMRQRQPELIDNRLLVVEVTDKDVEKYKFPQTDAILAEAIAKLQQFQPLTIGLNMHRNSAREPGRKKLISLFDSNPNIITVCSYGSQDKNYDPPPELSKVKSTNQLGFSDLTPDELRHEKGSSIRRQSLSYEPSLSPFTNNCKISNSFSFMLALRFLENQGIKSQITNNEEWRIGDVTFKRLATRSGGYQDLKPLVSQILLNYRANPKPGFKVTLQEVLEGKINSDLVKGKIVLIGHTSEASRDESDTPYGKMPGVWIHAHMVSQILSAAIDKRPLMWVLPSFQGLQWGDAVFVWLLAVTGGLLAWRSRSLLVLAIASGGMIFVLYQGSLVILTFGGWMPLVPAGLAFVATGGILFVYDRS